jgi:hypothetical protein
MDSVYEITPILKIKEAIHDFLHLRLSAFAPGMKSNIELYPISVDDPKLLKAEIPIQTIRNKRTAYLKTPKDPNFPS